MRATINWAQDLKSVTDAFADLPCASDGVDELSFRDLAGLAGGLARHLLDAGLVPGAVSYTHLTLPTIYSV